MCYYRGANLLPKTKKFYMILIVHIISLFANDENESLPTLTCDTLKDKVRIHNRTAGWCGHCVRDRAS